MSAKISPQEFYDKFASSYDAWLQDPTINIQHIYEAAKIFQTHNSSQSGSLLDVGCGTGLLKDLLQREFDCTGIDIAGNMLHYAAERGYKTIHKPTEEALPQIPDASYDFVFALSSLLFVEDIESALAHLNRIARQSVLVSLDSLSEDYIRSFAVAVYDHSQVAISHAKEDYLIRGWTSPTTGITIHTRMIYIEKS